METFGTSSDKSSIEFNDGEEDAAGFQATSARGGSPGSSRFSGGGGSDERETETSHVLVSDMRVGGRLCIIQALVRGAGGPHREEGGLMNERDARYHLPMRGWSKRGVSNSESSEDVCPGWRRAST